VTAFWGLSVPLKLRSPTQNVHLFPPHTPTTPPPKGPFLPLNQSNPFPIPTVVPTHRPGPPSFFIPIYPLSPVNAFPSQPQGAPHGKPNPPNTNTPAPPALSAKPQNQNPAVLKKKGGPQNTNTPPTQTPPPPPQLRLIFLWILFACLTVMAPRALWAEYRPFHFPLGAVPCGEERCFVVWCGVFRIKTTPRKSVTRTPDTASKKKTITMTLLQQNPQQKQKKQPPPTHLTQGGQQGESPSLVKTYQTQTPQKKHRCLPKNAASSRKKRTQTNNHTHKPQPPLPQPFLTFFFFFSLFFFDFLLKEIRGLLAFSFNLARFFLSLYFGPFPY